MGVPGQSFFRFLLRRALQPTFPSIFHRFLTKKSMYFSLLFSSHPCFFLDMATFTIVWFFPIETYFFIFCFFVFFCKKWSKINVKKQMKKKDWKLTSQDPFLNPKIDKIGTEGFPKWLKNRKKKFLRGWFFDDFLDGQKSHSQRSFHSLIFQYGWVLASLGDIGGTIKDNPIYWLSNTPLGRWPGELSNINYALLITAIIIITIINY